MRIAIVTHNVVRGDGQGRVNYENTLYALSQGAQVTLFANRVDTALCDAGANWVPIHPKIQKPITGFIREFVMRSNQIVAAQRQNFDVIHAYGYTLNIPHHLNTSQFVHSTWRKSSVHPFRYDKSPYGFYQYTDATFNSRWEKESYAKANHIVAASHLVKTELVDIGVPGDKIRVIHNAVDVNEFQPGQEQRSKWGLPEGVSLALFAGDIRLPRKNLGTVLEAMVNVPHAHLAVIGNTKHSPYPAMAAKLGLSERVHFLGYRRDIAEVMKVVDLFVFPSCYEPFGIVVLEAMATGVPVISARSVGASEIITPESGVLVDDPLDKTALAQAWSTLANQNLKSRAMGEVARKIAEQNTWTRMAKKYFEIYREISGA